MRRFARISVGIAATATMLAGMQTGAHAASPISGSNRPTPLAGQVNGEVASGQLVQVSANCRTARAAGPSLSLLLKSAEAHGVTVTASECYRPLSGQVNASNSWTQAGNSACAAAPTKTSTGKVVGTSMHGWGKAADFRFGGGSWDSPGYKFLKSAAGAYGWNHPGWAEPGGSACPEAWHWEWVGDGGTAGADQVVADRVGFLTTSDEQGYATVTGLGGVATSGSFSTKGDASSIPLNWVMVGAASTPDRDGYWMVGADGGVFAFGSAGFHGSTGGMKLNRPVVGMAPTPSGKGYWLVASDGGVFAYGDAQFHGSTGSMKLNKAVVGMTPTPTGGGYWLVAADGGIFAFGDAPFFGSTGSMKLNKPVMGIAATVDGGGYWLVAEDGGVFAFGNAAFLGSAGGAPPTQPITTITRTKSGGGYWMTVANGDVHAYGDAKTFAKN
jgi:hypothetical protein